MNIIYPYTIQVDKGRLPKRGKYGNRYTNELSKILEEFPPGEGKTPVCEQEH
jgi:hypothetical protein